MRQPSHPVENPDIPFSAGGARKRRRLHQNEAICIIATMSTITAILEPDADGTLHLPIPPELRHQAIKVKAKLEAAVPSGGESNLKGFGCLRGKISMAADFDEPLEDFQDYMG